jgi:hypothetical protein
LSLENLDFEKNNDGGVRQKGILNKVQNRQNFFNKAVSLVALSFCPPLTIKIFGKTDKRLSGGRIQQQTR